MNFVRRFGFIIIGFLIGVVIFFPWNDVKDFMTGELSKQGIQLQISHFSPTTGLRMGPLMGSLFAFEGAQATLRLPGGQGINCDSMLIGPRFWPLLMGQLQVSLGCMDSKGSMVAVVKASPFWNPSMISVVANFSTFSLSNLQLNSDFQGSLSGDVEVKDATVKGGLGEITWSINGKDVRTPDAAFPLAKIPSLDLGNVESNGNFGDGAVNVKSFTFGSAQSLVEGRIVFSSDLDKQMIPQRGEMHGTLRVDPEAEATTLKDLPFKLIFGQPDARGKREFKKSFTGGIQSLLFQSGY